MALLDIVVCHAAALGFLVELLVRRVGVFGDDVPGVDETREEAQTAESDVDERVGRAEAAFDPYYELLATGTFEVHVLLVGPCCTDGCATCVEKEEAVVTHQRGAGRGWPGSPGKCRCRTC